MMNTLPAGELLELFLRFLTLSLLSIGGAMSTAPEMHRYLVVARGWRGDADFTTAIALAQAAPGPDRENVRALVMQELRRLHEGVLARYGLRPAELERWRSIQG